MKISEHIAKRTTKQQIKEYLESLEDQFMRKNIEHNFIITFNDKKSIEEYEEKELKGLAISIKDAFTTKNLRTTAGSKILENYLPVFDATIVKRLKQKGAHIIAKTAMDEFGFGSFSLNNFTGPVKNAIDKNYVAGGSSGGSGVATALANDAHVSIAESTGGSITAPAVFNGVYGLTPTYGLLSRYGLIDYASSLDKPGIMAKYIDDIITILDIITGKDEKDSTSLEKPVKSYIDAINNENPSIYKIAYIKEYVEQIKDKEVKKAFVEFIEFLKSQGWEVEEASIKYLEESLAAYYIIATSEASTNLAKFSGMRYGYEENVEGKFYDEYFSEIRSKAFGEEAKRRIILGTFARMSGYRDAYYLKAFKIRTLVIEEFKRLFKNYDLLLAPAMPILPIKIEEANKLTPAETYAIDILTTGLNLASIPHLAIPLKTSTKFPAGMHIIGDHLKETKILAFAKEIEKTYKRLFI